MCLQVLRLQMTERSLSHMLNLVRCLVGNKVLVEVCSNLKFSSYAHFILLSLQAPMKHRDADNGTAPAESNDKPKKCNGAPLLSECALQEVRDNLELHLCLSALLTLPLMLIAPSLMHWIRNLRYANVAMQSSYNLCLCPSHSDEENVHKYDLIRQSWYFILKIAFILKMTWILSCFSFSLFLSHTHSFSLSISFSLSFSPLCLSFSHSLLFLSVSLSISLSLHAIKPNYFLLMQSTR